MKKDKRVFLDNKLNNYMPYGTYLFYLFEKGEISPFEMRDMFYDDSQEKCVFKFSSIIKNASCECLKKANEYVVEMFPEEVDLERFSIIQILDELTKEKDLFINSDEYKYYLQKLNERTAL